MSEATQKNVPALRFPEFSGEWIAQTLLELSKNGFSNGVFNDPRKVGSGYKLINVKDMYQGNEIIIETLTLLKLSQKEFDNNKVRWGDVFFTRSSLVKEGIAHSCVFLSDDEFTTYDGHLIRMSPDRDRVIPQYLGYVLKTGSSRKQLVARGKTTTMTTIGQEDISSVVIVIGEPDEQKKIASFLSAMDEKIEQITRKKELLEQYKKGMMQKIFNQEIRFKSENGSDFPNWEEKRLGEVATKQSSNIAENSIADNVGPYKIYGAAGVLSSICSFQHEDEYISIVKDGAGVGRVFLCDPKTSILGTLDAISGKSGTNLKFLFYIILNIDFGRYTTGSTIPHIYFRDYSKGKFRFPHLLEQQKIADFLSAIDAKIDAVASQVTQMEAFKKGLLQQMFV